MFWRLLEESKDQMSNPLTTFLRQARRRRTIDQLMGMDDRMLADIGVTRGDLVLMRDGGKSFPHR